MTTEDAIGQSLPDFAAIRAAERCLAGQAVRTPLLESSALNRQIGGRLLVKAEPLQRTGSFKFRGAFNAISQIAPDRRAAGVVAFSSGNHAQGVAHAAQIAGIPATIIMPGDAPLIKIANTRAYGAEVILYDRKQEDREAIARAHVAHSGATLVPPYDDRAVIAGQGTIGLEIAEQATAAGATLDALIVCCSGGGLVAGCALALAELQPGVAVYSAEPAAFDDTARSLREGVRVTNSPDAVSFCDALLVNTPGRMTFHLNQRLLAAGLAVSDAEVGHAMRQAFEHFKIVVEPGGAVALAAALSNRLPTQGRTIAVVLSGGNVDPEAYARILKG